MNRYRLALAAVAVLIVAAVLFTVVRMPAPPAAPRPRGTGRARDDRHPAPDFTGIDGWLNSSPLTLAGLRGKVVLIVSGPSRASTACAPSRTRVLYNAYKDKGLVVVGVRSRSLISRWPGQRLAAVDPPRRHLAGRHRQPDGHMERLSETVLARRVPARPAGPGWRTPPSAREHTRRPTRRWPAGDGQATLPIGDAGAIEHHTGAVPRAASAARSPTVRPMRDRTRRTTRTAGHRRPRTGPDHRRWTDEGQYLQADSAGHVRLQFQADSLYVVAGLGARSPCCGHA